MSIELPKPIAAYFSADAQNSNTFSDCFTSNAVVTDEGQTYSGIDAIGKWKAEASKKYTYTSEPFAIHESAGKTIVTSHLVGNFPGSPVDLRYAFALDGNKIAALVITL